MNENKAPIMRVYTDGQAPTRGTEKSAGLDLYNNGDTVIMHRGVWRAVETKTHVEIPDGYFGMVVPRSGLGMKGITLVNGTGIIDSDYRGEIGIKLQNTGTETVVIESGDRVAQLIILPYLHVDLERVPSVEVLTDTKRGRGGFGSTGR